MGGKCISRRAGRAIESILEGLESRVLLSTFSVTSNADSGAGSLRQAITDANANPGADVIDFNISSDSKQIKPRSSLPLITEDLTIDGTTQPGYTNRPIVEINGPLAGDSTDAFTIKSGAVTIKGLSITSFGGAGIIIGSAGNCVIQGNNIGVDPTGRIARGNGTNAIVIAGSANNMIGGTEDGQANILAHNGLRGISATGGSSAPAVLIYGSGTGNSVLRNSIYDNRGFAIDNVASGNLPDALPQEQGRPSLYYAGLMPGDTHVLGSLSSTPNTTFRIELFGNDNAFRNIGPVQTKTFIAAKDVITGDSGGALIDIDVPVTSYSALFTVTATGPDGSTTETGVPKATQAGNITGAVFDDANANGIKDRGEAGIPGVTVFLDQSSNGSLNVGEPSTVTDAHGNYSFTDVQGGPERVSVVVPDGRRLTYPSYGYWNMTLPTSGSTKRFFGLTSTAIVRGSVFNDINSNQKQDSGETNLSGWFIYIDKNNNGALDSNEHVRITDRFGNYRFNGLDAGTYVIRIQSQDGFVFTLPSGKTLKLSAGQSRSNQNFAVHATA